MRINSSSDREIVIIGAGMGGLAAAVTLAARGHRVRVIDALERAGGKMGVAEHEGVRFDTGPSILTLRHVLDELCAVAGSRLEDELELINASPMFRYIYPGGEVVDVHHELEGTLESVREALGGDAAAELRAFLTYSRNIWEAARPNFIDGEAPSFTSVFKLGVTRFRQVMQIDPLHTMIESIQSRVKDERLRWLLMRYATYNGSSPFAAPATLNCIAWVELGLGGWGVRGGMGEIPKALQRLAERHGATFEWGVRATRILTARDGSVRGVQLDDGRELATSCVIANADASHVIDALLGPNVDHQLPSIDQPSMSGWTAILKARRGEVARAAHTVVFPEDYAREFQDIFDHDRPPTDPTVYLCAQEANHQRAGWPEHEPVFVMANAPCEPAQGQRDPALYEALRARVLDRIERAGLMAAGDELVWERTPAQLAQTFPGSRGSIYGAASNSQLAAFKRPPNRVKRVPGLYLASGSAHPGGGVPLCLMSGQTAARAAMEDMPTRRSGSPGARTRVALTAALAAVDRGDEGRK